MKIEKQAIIVVDLGFGDAGKGAITDYLTREFNAHTVVRYNGGAQAAHNVTAPDGRHHTFAQFGSGTFVGAKTHLSKYMLVNPLSMLKEERHLQTIGITDAFLKSSIEKEALITTPFHQAVNKLKEMARGENRHGSCGMGIGEAKSDFLKFKTEVLFAKDLLDKNQMAKKLRFIKEIQLEKIKEIKDAIPKDTLEIKTLEDPEIIENLSEVYRHFSSLAKIVDEDFLKQLLEKPGTVIFEGAQGVLLDELYGFYPYTTWSDTTTRNAQNLLTDHNWGEKVSTLGVMRAYATRHGAGPFVTEDSALTKLLPDDENVLNSWQGRFRVGYPDMLMTRYAMEVVGKVDSLAINHLDRLCKMNYSAVNYGVSLRESSSVNHSSPKPAAKYSGSRIKSWQICESYQSDNPIDRIPVLRPTSIDYQSEITKFLANLKPNYQTIPRETSLISYFESSLGTPVSILSFGKSSTDKCLRKQL